MSASRTIVEYPFDSFGIPKYVLFKCLIDIDDTYSFDCYEYENRFEWYGRYDQETQLYTMVDMPSIDVINAKYNEFQSKNTAPVSNKNNATFCNLELVKQLVKKPLNVTRYSQLIDNKEYVKHTCEKEEWDEVFPSTSDSVDSKIDILLGIASSSLLSAVHIFNYNNVIVSSSEFQTISKFILCAGEFIKKLAIASNCSESNRGLMRIVNNETGDVLVELNLNNNVIIENETFKKITTTGLFNIVIKSLDSLSIEIHNIKIY